MRSRHPKHLPKRIDVRVAKKSRVVRCRVYGVDRRAPQHGTHGNGSDRAHGSVPLGRAMTPKTPESPESRLEDLLGAVARSDRTAFAALYEITSAKLYGIAFRLLKRRDVTDDVLQDVYVRIWDRAVDFDVSRGPPMAWMGTIARNRALDELRRKKSTMSAVDGDADVEQVIGEEKSPLAALELSEEVQRLFHCLNKLDAERREIILLAYRDGLSREELGRRFSRPVGTIKTWLHRSLTQLKTCLTND
jgi:RNA polymerase sigma-70 factor, ECF subfamily